MSLSNDIHIKVRELLAPGTYSMTSSNSIPGPGDNRVTFGNTSVQFEAATLFIDMRGSTKVLNSHQPYTAVKIHKAYLYVATTVIAREGGHIRSYNGDSILAFFEGEIKHTIEKSIRAAMRIKFLLSKICQEEFERYSSLDFGIGVDQGLVLCVKAGRARNENHNDLIWLGNSVNRATVLSDSAGERYNVWISDHCRQHLTDNVKLSKSDDMWIKSNISYNGADETAWKSSYWWKV